MIYEGKPLETKRRKAAPLRVAAREEFNEEKWPDISKSSPFRLAQPSPPPPCHGGSVLDFSQCSNVLAQSRMCLRYTMIILIQIGLLLSLNVWAQGISPPCCSQVPGSCRTACEQMSLVAVATSKEERLKNLQVLNVYCSRELESFWICINETLKDVDRGDGWPGRPCCYLPQSTTCRLTCLQSQNRNDLLQGCRQSDEIAFYTCVDRQEVGEICCNNAQTNDCHRACKEVFLSSQTPSHQVRTSVDALCSQNSPKVVECVHNYTRTTPSNNPQKNLHCCDKSQNEQCRNTCRKILRANSSSQEVVMDTLIEGGCGQPVLHDSLWQCFLSNSGINRQDNVATPRTGKLGMDSAKLHCCFKAVTPICQKLCFKTFSNEWGSSWKLFHQSCLYKPAESQMLRCIEEVDEPCELGCEELSYCSNFNNRPTEMFRSCNAWSDHGARSEMDIWRGGFINTSTISIPIVDTGKCFPSMWKGIACMLAVKPCTNRHSFAGLCRSDCINSLTNCIDYRRLPRGMTPETICDTLLPTGHDFSCTPLATYLEPSPHRLTGKQVSFPCRPNPCNVTDICLVNRDCGVKDKCLPYKCVSGCRMGDTSLMTVPRGSLVHIPTSGINPGCQKVCLCSDRSTFEDCVTLPCQPTDGCWIGGKQIAHKATFQLDCNTCACFAGEVTCSNQPCPVIGDKAVQGVTGLPCNCPNHYVPVCGSNGKTYPSACVATCTGLPDHRVEFGACSAIDPCQPNPCRRNQRCIPVKNVCLGLSKNSCPQYKCVDNNQDCHQAKKHPACDSYHHQHASLCSLLQKDRVLAYMGPCLKTCRNVGPVCGQNGETYATECNAWADRMLVDYQGPCVAVGIIKERVTGTCRGVLCPAMPQTRCRSVTPPGACCPICGASIKMLYSQKQTERIDQVLKSGVPLTVQSVVQSFREHVKVAQCDVYGYLSMEGEIVLVVTVVGELPTMLQLETCTKEAEKLELMVQLGSSIFLNDFKLSAITAAMPVNNSAKVYFLTAFWLLLAAIVHLMFNRL